MSRGVAARLANHDGGFEQDVAGGLKGLGDPAEHRMHGGLTDLLAGLAEGSQGNAEQGGVGDIVDTGKADLLGDFDRKGVQGTEQHGGGGVVAAHKAVGGELTDGAFDLADGGGIGKDDALVGVGDLGSAQDVQKAGNAVVDGVARAGEGEEGRPTGTAGHDVASHAGAAAPVVDTDQVEGRAVRITEKAPVEEDDGDAGVGQGLGDGGIGGRLGRAAFDGSEEDARDPAGNILPAEFTHAGGIVGGGVGGVPPEEGMPGSGPGAAHPLANGLKYFSFA